MGSHANNPRDGISRFLRVEYLYRVVHDDFGRFADEPVKSDRGKTHKVPSSRPSPRRETDVRDHRAGVESDPHRLPQAPPPVQRGFLGFQRSRMGLEVRLQSEAEVSNASPSVVREEEKRST
jgi:hypothetical protein